jgi:DNA-binding CsgD family transcriptional regulator
LEELQIRGVAGELTPTGTAIRGLRLYGRATIDRTNPIPTRPSQVERVMNADVQDRAVDGRRKRGPRPSRRIGWAALTPSELKIAALVAQGLTNPQIATRLFLSRSTVQTHLENVFAKLDIGSRVVLAAEIARRSA